MKKADERIMATPNDAKVKAAATYNAAADLYVKPDFRRMGAGNALLNELFAECHTRGCKFAHVEGGASNAPARALYAKFGLVPAQDGRVLLSGALPKKGS